MRILDGGGSRIDDEQVSLRELQGKTVVLEVIAMTCLALLLDIESEAGIETSACILADISQTVASRCRELDLSGDTCSAAHRYVENLTALAKTTLLHHS